MKVHRLGNWMLAALLLVNLGVGFLYSQERKNDKKDDVYAQIDALMEVIQLVRANYVEEDKTHADELFKNAIYGVMDSLDPFSNYLDKNIAEAFAEQSDGEFAGIGIQVDFKPEYAVVIAAIDGTPAYDAGLLPGDMILKVNEESVADLGEEDTIRRMRGAVGTPVRITIMRDSFKEPREIQLTRAMIPIVSVNYPMVRDGVGYVRISQFTERTAEELQTVLQEKFSGDDVKALVLDLRDNPGGLLTSAIDVCSFFLPKDAFVVSVEGRVDSSVNLAKDGYKFRNIPMAVLINQGSASAAEIVSGCLKHHGRAQLIGKNSFGKGSVQSLFSLSGGNEIKLTVAYYFVEPKGTPNRHKIHGSGIKPDVELTDSADDRNARAEQLKAFAKTLEDPNLTERQRVEKRAAFEETLRKDDDVFKRAVELLKGRKANTMKNVNK